MSDDERRDPAPAVTSMSLRAERLRRRFAQAAGAEVRGEDPGLSAQPRVRDPELTNRSAIVALIAGIVALFLDAFFVPSVVALIFGVLALRRARDLDARGRGAYGRRRALWAIGCAIFGAAGVLFQLFIRPLF